MNPSTSTAPDVDLDETVEDNDELTLVVSCFNAFNAEYIADYLSSSYKDDCDVEILDSSEFETKYGYRPPVKRIGQGVKRRVRQAEPLAQAPALDKATTDAYTCMYCGEKLVAPRKPEWAVKAKHALLHLKYQATYECVLCPFTCDRPLPMFKHMPIAHNNKMETHLYPVFTTCVDLDRFNEAVLECFPGTKCLSMIESGMDSNRKLPSYAYYYKLVLGKSKSVVQQPFTISLPSALVDSITSPEPSSPTPAVKKPRIELECSKCDFFSSDPRALHAHLKASHEKPYEIFCPICGMDFLQIGLLTRHISQTHSKQVQELAGGK